MASIIARPEHDIRYKRSHNAIAGRCCLMNTPSLYQIAEIELTYKSSVRASERPKVTDSASAYAILLQVWDENRIDLQEKFKVMLLNRASRVIGIYHHLAGVFPALYADPKLVMVAALKAGASGIILAHNHPSGNSQPSDADKVLTEKIRHACTLLDIRTYDHIILTSEGYSSFSDEQSYFLSGDEAPSP